MTIISSSMILPAGLQGKWQDKIKLQYHGTANSDIMHSIWHKKKDIFSACLSLKDVPSWHIVHVSPPSKPRMHCTSRRHYQGWVCPCLFEILNSSHVFINGSRITSMLGYLNTPHRHVDTQWHREINQVWHAGLTSLFVWYAPIKVRGCSPSYVSYVMHPDISIQSRHESSRNMSRVERDSYEAQCWSDFASSYSLWCFPSFLCLRLSLTHPTLLYSLSIHLSLWILIKVKHSFISIARQQVCCQMTFPELNMTWQPCLYNNRVYERQGDKARNYWDRVCSQTYCCFLFY